MKAAGGTAVAGTLFSTTAAARNPHCIKHDTYADGPDSSGDLDVCFKVSGLGNQDVVVTVYARAVACYACQNNGGNFPSDPKKQKEDTEVRNSVRITPENGTVQDCLTLSPPSTTLDCPNGQHQVLASIAYSNIRIVTKDAESGDVLAQCGVRGTFDETYYSGVSC